MAQELFPKELAFLSASTRRKQVGAGATRHELVTAPLITLSALAKKLDDFPQRSLLGVTGFDEERIYFNANAPSSGVICGVQGSGKSHTVSCILENALLQDERIGCLPQPLAGLVFHFDEQDGDRPCEAAYLSMPSNSFEGKAHVEHVTVLVSSTNLAGRRRAYRGLPNVDVQPLYLSESDLTAPRMLALMGWTETTEDMPLYLNTVMQIVRDLGIEGFNYTGFKEEVERQRFDPRQKAMLSHRFRIMDGFVRAAATPLTKYFGPGKLVLVDLTDPFLDGMTASLLFDIVLGSFMSWKSSSGRIVVLDEAHKYLTNSDSARLNKSVESIIRQQRHLATRVIIATQEPTVVPATILDLASFVMCHRFTSPSWCAHLARHVSLGNDAWFSDVMRLATGEALVFSASSLITRDDEPEPVLLGKEALQVHIRPRLTADGGASLLAVGIEGISLGESDDHLPESDGLPTPESLIPEVPPKQLQSPVPVNDGYPSPITPSILSSPPLPRPSPAGPAVKKIKPSSRFYPLVRAVLAKRPIVQVLWSDIAGDPLLSHLRGNKGWLKSYIAEAAGAGVVESGRHASPGTDWVRLR